MFKKPRAVKDCHIEMLTSHLVPFINSSVTFLGKERNRASCQKTQLECCLSLLLFVIKM